MSEVWDVVVVGAGPAGATAALAAQRARPDARVLLLDRSEHPRDKACGDGIAPHALEVLAGLGVTGLVEGYRPVRTLHLQIPDGPSVRGPMQRPAHVVPRRVLDARAAAAALDSGVSWSRHRVRSVERRDGLVVMDGEIAARVAIAADGALSVVRRSIGLPRNDDAHLAMALRGYAPVRADLADEQRIVLGEGRWPAYAWSFPIGDGRANVGYGEVLTSSEGSLTRDVLLERLEQLLPGTTNGGQDWRGHHLPLSSGRPRQPDGAVLLVGDALSLINPLTGEGIFYAVLSGACAGAVAVSGTANPGRAYRTLLRRRLGRHLRHTTVAAAMARRPRVVRAGVAAAGRHSAVFDDLVDLGLGDGLLSARTVRPLLVSGRLGW